MLFSNAQKFVEEGLKGEITNYNNPNCEKCNECCSIMALLSDSEYKELENYLTKNKLGKVIYKRALDRVLTKTKEVNGFYMICPFSNGLKKCDLYLKRPRVCRDFHCSLETKESDEAMKSKYGEKMIFSLFENDLLEDETFSTIFTKFAYNIGQMDILK